ncbi:hypothetical protein SNE40_013701 [Patella caerulea]|uniref:Uncharacterized protein n=1 Tax=Patella caerulea TaxID=87958 RepID=A0AAN8JC45_PATCE
MIDSGYQYGVNDRVDFNFDISFTSMNTTNLTIDIYGDSLQFESEISQVSMAWSIVPGDGDNSTFSPYVHGSTTTEELVKLSSVYRIQIDDFPESSWNFTGNFTAVVSDTAGPGSLVRGIIDLKFSIDNDSYSDQLVSDYVYTLPLRIWPVPHNGSLTLQAPLLNEVYMTFTEGTVTPKVTVTTPFDNSSKEVTITMQRISANATHGISDSDIDSLTSSYSYFRSTPETYQNDIGILQLPTVSRTDQDVYNESEIVVKVRGRLEDFTDISSVSKLDVGLGVMFGKTMIWVSKTVADIGVGVQPGERRPVLSLDMYQVCVIPNQERFDVTVSIVGRHTSASTATAYNVTLFLYAMDSMTHVSYALSLAKGYRSKWNTSGNVRTYEVERITFSTPMHTSVVEQIDMSTVAMQQAEDFVVMAEIGYTDRWVNDVEFWSGLQYVKLDLPRRCAQKLRWTHSTNCSCIHNPILTNCGCCDAGACQCGERNPTTCLPCDILTLCEPTIAGFVDYYSNLDDSEESTIVCDAFHKYRPGRKETSCYRQFNNEQPDQALSASVAVVLGVDTLTRILYGISNHGLAYVRSADGGLTWISISPKLYSNMASTGHFKLSSLVNIN